MLETLLPKNMLIIDIETVPLVPTLDDYSDRFKSEWVRKMEKERPEGVTEQDHYFANAGLRAEFGKIICISVGYFRDGVQSTKPDDNERESLSDTRIFSNQTLSNNNEYVLLSQFVNLIAHPHFKNNHKLTLVGHNIISFDIPFICRRLIANGLAVPLVLDMSDKKPWEMNVVDTMALWRFGDYRHYTSLSLLTAVMDLPSPKHDLDASQVGVRYWHHNELNRIAQYCHEDVLAVARIVHKFRAGNKTFDETWDVETWDVETKAEATE